VVTTPDHDRGAGAVGLTDRGRSRTDGSRRDARDEVHDGRDLHPDDRGHRDDVGRGRADVADPVVVPARRSGAAVAALILGVLGLLLSVVPLVGLVGSLLGVIAIVLGVVGIVRARKPATKGAGMAVTGIVCGVLSLALGAAGLTLFSDAASELEDPANDLIEDVERELDEATN
jgi:hypothetical protein